MKSTAMLATAVALLLSGCMINGDTGADETSALLHELEQGDIDDTHFRAELARVDGRTIPDGARRTYRLAPGRHVLGFELDVESLAQFESGVGSRYQDPSGGFADVNEKSVEVELEAGKSYKFGALVEDFNYAGWQPYVTEAKD